MGVGMRHISCQISSGSSVSSAHGEVVREVLIHTYRLVGCGGDDGELDVGRTGNGRRTW